MDVCLAKLIRPPVNESDVLTPYERVRRGMKIRAPDWQTHPTHGWRRCCIDVENSYLRIARQILSSAVPCAQPDDVRRSQPQARRPSVGQPGCVERIPPGIRRRQNVRRKFNNWKFRSVSTMTLSGPAGLPKVVHAFARRTSWHAMSDVTAHFVDSEGEKMILEPHSTSNHSSGGSKPSVVYVVDDDESVRLALGALLRSVGLRVETFGSSHEFLAFAKYDAPSCLILDVRLRGESGLTFQEEVAKSGLHMPILFMTGHGDVEMSVKAMKAGALDFFSKPFRDQDMLDAVSNALTCDAARRAAEQSIAALRACYDSLTSREREVMGFAVAGLMNKQIASEINLSEITVKIHRGQAMKKMAARSVADLVRKAEALGIEPHHTKPS